MFLLCCDMFGIQNNNAHMMQLAEREVVRVDQNKDAVADANFLRTLRGKVKTIDISTWTKKTQGFGIHLSGRVRRAQPDTFQNSETFKY